MTLTAAPPEASANPALRALARRSFCTLATASGDNAPHAVGVLYSYVDGAVYVATSEDSKKVRNIKANPRVAVCVQVRRYPVGPPFTVQFQGTAQVLSLQDPHIERLLRGRRLRKITGHGVLDDPGTCFLRIVPDRRISTYGVGVPLRTLLRDPLAASRTFSREAEGAVG